MDIRNLIRENIRNLAPYSTARDDYQGTELSIALDANENPYDNGVNRYPDPRQKALKARLSQIKGVPVESIFVGNGSDEPIDLVYRVFCEPKVHNAVAIAPTYSMYKVAAEINDVEVREVQLEEDFSLDADKLLAATDANTRLLWLCSPNNPTANSFPTATIERIIREFAGIVVLDEAYIDFAAEPGFLSRLGEFPNLIVLQTLSKAWGMAGLRLGLAFADPADRRYAVECQVPLQRERSHTADRPRTARRVARRAGGRDTLRTPTGRRSAATDESRAQTLPVGREFRAGKKSTNRARSTIG